MTVDQEKRKTLRLCYRGSIVVLGLGLLPSCVTTGGSSNPTQPNSSLYHAQAEGAIAQELKLILAKIAASNENLAVELGKIPEMHEDINEEKVAALESLYNMYQGNPGNFDGMFAKMDSMGIKNVRKYCAPLQGFFWLIYDGNEKVAKKMASVYSPWDLLRYAWPFPRGKNGEKRIAFNLMDSCIDESLKVQSKGKPLSYTIELARQNPDGFLFKVPNGNIMKRHDERWDDFDTVVDRLSDPILVHEFVENNFVYRRGDFPRPSTAFRRKYGNCGALADLGEYILGKAGYDTFIRAVSWPGDPCTSEHIGSGIKNIDGTYILVIDFGPNGNSYTGRPYSLEQLDRKLSSRKEIDGARWGHGKVCDFWG